MTLENHDDFRDRPTISTLATSIIAGHWAMRSRRVMDTGETRSLRWRSSHQSPGERGTPGGKANSAPRFGGVFGASEDLEKFEGRIIHFLIQHGFPGCIVPINPRRKEIRGPVACKSLSDKRPDKLSGPLVSPPGLSCLINSGGAILQCG